MVKIGVSACLIGKNTKYDGTNNKNDKIIKYLKDKEVYPICPEVLGGLDIPRSPSEIIKDKVINKEGKDVTYNFEQGAIKALKFLQERGVDTIILKSKSPSCGYNKIYDGTFSGKLIDGNGMFTRLALAYNFKILTEEDF